MISARLCNFLVSIMAYYAFYYAGIFDAGLDRMIFNAIGYMMRVYKLNSFDSSLQNGNTKAKVLQLFTLSRY